MMNILRSIADSKFLSPRDSARNLTFLEKYKKTLKKNMNLVRGLLRVWHTDK